MMIARILVIIALFLALHVSAVPVSSVRPQISAVDAAQPVLDHNVIDIVNRANTSWNADVNDRLDGLTVAEFASMLGYVPSGTRGAEPTHLVDDRMVVLPKSFDSRKEWPECSVISTIRDQSACGSCYVFGSVEAFEDRLCIESKGRLTNFYP